MPDALVYHRQETFGNDVFVAEINVMRLLVPLSLHEWRVGEVPCQDAFGSREPVSKECRVAWGAVRRFKQSYSIGEVHTI